MFEICCFYCFFLKALSLVPNIGAPSHAKALAVPSCLRYVVFLSLFLKTLSLFPNIGAPFHAKALAAVSYTHLTLPTICSV